MLTRWHEVYNYRSLILQITQTQMLSTQQLLLVGERVLLENLVSIRTNHGMYYNWNGELPKDTYCGVGST